MLRLPLLITLALVALAARAQMTPDKPRLVLMLVVDNLNNEQLDIVRNECGRDGFNRLLAEGTVCRNAYYDAGGNYSGKNMATLFTGAPASTHGVVSETWIDRFDNRKVHAIYGKVYDSQGRIGADTLVADNRLLLCSTITNQIRKKYNSAARVVSLGFDPDMLIWLSGMQQAEPTFWFDTRTGNFVGNNAQTPDTMLRKAIDCFNSKRIADVYLGKQWAPRNDISQYHEWKYFKSTTGAQRTFYYNMRQSPAVPPDYSLVAGSPYGNTLLRDLAASVLLDTRMGRDDVPDVLMLQFNATPSTAHKTQPLDAETEDLLLCLDDNIADLLRLIDHEIGMDNTLVVLCAARGSYDLSHTPQEQWNSRGSVSLHRASALLNLYLMALHGQGRWVDNYKSGEMYMNAELAKEKGVDFALLCSEAADFLTQMQGIGTAIAASTLDRTFALSPVVNGMKRNYHRKRSGDVLFALEPGWAEEQDDGSCIMQLWGQEFVPLVFAGWRIGRNAVLYERHNMADVAPTICTFLNVQKPDGCSGSDIPLIK